MHHLLNLGRDVMLHFCNTSLYSFICCLQFNVQSLYQSIDVTHSDQDKSPVPCCRAMDKGNGGKKKKKKKSKCVFLYACAKCKPPVYLRLLAWKPAPLSLVQAGGTVGPPPGYNAASAPSEPLASHAGCVTSTVGSNRDQSFCLNIDTKTLKIYKCREGRGKNVLNSMYCETGRPQTSPVVFWSAAAEGFLSTLALAYSTDTLHPSI